MTPSPVHTLDRAVALMEREVELRGQARHLELDPLRTQEAAQLFRRANGLRRARLALLERCGLR